MSLACLQLEKYRLSSLHVDFNDGWLQQSDESRTESYGCIPEFETFESEQPNRYLMRLSLVCDPSEPDGIESRFSRVQVSLWGMFCLDKQASDDEKRQLLPLNAVAMLHGIARGLLISATGGCVGGPFILPAINYIEDLQARTEKPLHSDGATDGSHDKGGERKMLPATT